MTHPSYRALQRFAVLALATTLPVAGSATVGSTHDRASAPVDQVHPTSGIMPKPPTLAVTGPSRPAASAPAMPVADAPPAIPRPTATANPRKDSASAMVYKVAPRPFDSQHAARLLKTFALKPKLAKPDSTPVNWVYRDPRGAVLTYERGISEFAYSNDSVAFVDQKELVPDSLIRRRTDALLKGILGERSLQYAFVNHEVTMVRRRDEDQKDAASPVPAYYIGRYLRKLGGRHVLGDGFQVRLSYGAGGALNYMSYRDPHLVDSSSKVKVPTREIVEEYLAEWSRDPRRLGRQIFPYHPDKFRIRALKPIKVFESYVQIPEKDGSRLVPKVTVLAEAILMPPSKRSPLPPPQTPVLLHFHFPCSPEAGLCWPDGKQGIQDRRAQAPTPTPAQTVPTTPPASPKTAP